MIHHGRLEDILPTLEPESFDAVVCDPPYHLTNSRSGPHRANGNQHTPHGRARIGDRGFMGQTWDGGDIAFNPETWRAVMRVMKPGAHLLAFGGPRTYHRMACAVEDAGFQIRDQIMWVFGSGFPKSRNQHGRWKGWGTALKPAHEPIVVARKPFRGTVEANLEAHGTGALHIAACLIETGDELVDREGKKNGIPCRNDPAVPRGRRGEKSADRVYKGGGVTDFTGRPGPRDGGEDGRWPANLVHDGSDEVVARFPAVAGGKAPITGDEPSMAVGHGIGNPRKRVAGAWHADVGGAERFFYCAKASAEERERGCEHLPKGRAGLRSETSDRRITEREGYDVADRANTHPTVKPIALMRWMCRLVTPPGGRILDCFAGSGSTLIAAQLEGFDAVGIERESEHVAIARARLHVWERGLAL